MAKYKHLADICLLFGKWSWRVRIYTSYKKHVEEEITIIRASLTSSHRLSNDIRQLWIVFKSDRSVITGFCTYTVEHSSCYNHIDAVLCKLNYANEKEYTNPACTDEICNWNSPSKEIHRIKAKDMDILQHNQEKSKQKRFLA